MSANENAYHFSIAHDVLEELIFSVEYDQRPSFALLQGHQKEKNIHLNGFSALQVADLNNPFLPVRIALNEELVIQTREKLLKDESLNPTHPSMGWFIAQPQSAAKPTDDILRVHFSLFNLPHLPILIYDTHHKSIALYHCADSLQLKNISFQVTSSLPSND